MGLIERWTIQVCEDCGRTRQDTSHGKCSTPTRWRAVEVVPSTTYQGAVDREAGLRGSIKWALQTDGDLDAIREGLREALRDHPTGGQ